MTAVRSGPAFSIHDIPFSAHGSWFGISPVLAEKTRAEDLHLVSHQNGMHAVLRFIPLDTTTHDRVAARIDSTPSLLSWVREGGCVELAYAAPDIVRLRGEGMGLRITAAATALTPFTGTYFYRDPVADAYVFTSYETGRRYRITVLSGVVTEAMGNQSLGSGERGIDLTADAAGIWEAAVEELDSARAPLTSAAVNVRPRESRRPSVWK